MKTDLSIAAAKKLILIYFTLQRLFAKIIILQILKMSVEKQAVL